MRTVRLGAAVASFATLCVVSAGVAGCSGPGGVAMDVGGGQYEPKSSQEQQVSKLGGSAASVTAHGGAKSVSRFTNVSAEESATVPDGVSSVLLFAQGGSGGAGVGAQSGGEPGLGAVVSGWAPVTAGAPVVVDVGQAGGSGPHANQGGSGGSSPGGAGGYNNSYWSHAAGGGGGGASTVTIGGTILAIAGGGGGGGGGTDNQGNNPAGRGGDAGAVAQDGQTVNTVRGGVAGASTTGAGDPGQSKNSSSYSLPGGAGGGGKAGGGGGSAGGSLQNYLSGGGGAAGTSLVAPSLLIPSISTASSAGAGTVTLVWNPTLTTSPADETVPQYTTINYAAYFGGSGAGTSVPVGTTQLFISSNVPSDQIEINPSNAYVTFNQPGQHVVTIAAPGYPGAPVATSVINVDLDATKQPPATP